MLIKSLAAAALVAAIAPAMAEAADIEVGQLTCRQTDRSNLIFFSDASFSCLFHPVEGPNERYDGSVSKIGVDLGSNKVETIVWFVFAPSSGIAPGALEGAYYGGSADASLGTGAGVRALVGGFDRSITLQPAAVSGHEGMGVAAGVEQFELKFRN